ncbi:MAG TPA: alkaline phosphatase family protein [Polyangiaceae bacterium]
MGGLLRSTASAFVGAVGVLGVLVMGCATGGGTPLAGDQPDATARHEAGSGADAAFAADGEPASDAASNDEGAPGADATLADAGDDGASSESSDGGMIVEGDGPTFDVPHDASVPVDAGVDASEPDAAPFDASSDEASVDGGAGDAADAGDAAAEAATSCACGAGFTCGSTRYCATSTGVPEFGHVYVIVLDNQPLTAIQGNTAAPYLNGLMATYAYGTDYSTTIHPSLPNLIDLTSGNPQQIACDCSPGTSNTCNGLNCNALAGTCACPVAVSHLGDELDVASIPWREYAESMGAPCNAADGGANFAANHVPFLYYADVFGNNGRCVQRVRDFGDFAADLASGAYRFSLISPDLCNDMHGGCGAADPVKQGDLWLAGHVPAILATAGFGSSGTDVLFIVGDEPDPVGTAPVPFLVVSPLAKHVATPGAYTHDSLLATIEDGLGIPRMGNTIGSGTIADVWR